MFRSIRISLCLVLAILASKATAENNSPVTIVSPWEIASYDPAVSGFATQKLEIMENLVDAEAKGTLRHSLATAWTVSNDGLVWEFMLREGVKFHDGSDFNAAAAVFSLTRSWNQPGVLKKAPIENILARNGKLIVQLKKPFTALPAFLAHASTIIIAKSAFTTEDKPSSFIGTGPFMVSAYTPPQSISLIRNEAYWGAKAHLKNVTYLAASRAETRALLAESGDADIVFTLDAPGYSHLKTVNKTETFAVPIPRVVVLKVNAGHSFFNDPRARQALSLAVPREGIARVITRFPETSANQLFPPALKNWHATDIEPLNTDIDAAKLLLAELGWVAGADGILTRGQERFSITLRTFPDRPELPLIATVLQSQWREVGIELEVSVGNYSEIPAGHQDGSLDVALYARNYGLTPDPIGSVLQDFGKGGGDWGAMGWENDQVVDVLKTISTTTDDELRKENIAMAVQILQQELPVIPVVWYQHTVAVNKKLRGVIIDPLQRSYGLSEMYWAD